MKKRTLLILLLVVSLLLTACQKQDSLVTLGKIAWTSSGALGTPEEYKVRHLHFDDVSVLKSKIDNWQDYDWIPASGEIFIFLHLENANSYHVVLTENGELCKVHSQIVGEDFDLSDFSSIDDMLSYTDELLFFVDLMLDWIGNTNGTENVPGQWHFLTEKQIQQLDK